LKKIAFGFSRDVFVHPDNSSFALKRAKGAKGREDNYIEYAIYNACFDLHWFLVPVISCKPGYWGLVALRGDKVRGADKDLIPTQGVPACLVDIGARNWVMINGRPMLADYGNKFNYFALTGECL